MSQESSKTPEAATVILQDQVKPIMQEQQKQAQQQPQAIKEDLKKPAATAAV